MLSLPSPPAPPSSPPPCCTLSPSKPVLVAPFFSSFTCSSCPMQILGRGLEIGRSGPLTTGLSRGPGTVISSGSELSTGLRCSSQDLLTRRYLGHRRLREPYCITCMTPSGISRVFFIVTYICDFTTSLGLSKGHKNVKVCILLRRLLPSVGNTLSPSNHTKAYRERTKHVIVSASMSYEHPQQFPFPFFFPVVLCMLGKTTQLVPKLYLHFLF